VRYIVIVIESKYQQFLLPDHTTAVMPSVMPNRDRQLE